MGNLHLVTGFAGQAHVAAADHGSLFEALIRSGQFVMEAGANFAASVVTNNQIRISDGELMMQGRHVKLNPGSYVDLVIDNGTQGMLRNDLIVARYTRNSESGIEECNLIVIKGMPAANNPADPEYTTGNINANGDLQHDFPLYRVPLSGLNVGELVPLFELQKSLLDYVADNFAPAGYGLGGKGVVVTSLNNLIDTGVYSYNYDAPGNPFPGYAGLVEVNASTVNIKQTITMNMYDGARAERVMRSEFGETTYGPWEYINPPMMIGVEYRTTERYKGEAVFKKLNTNGDILWRVESETAWRLQTSASYVAVATVE